MKDIINDLKFTVFDFETTGYSPYKGAEIIEVGAVKIRDGEIEAPFQEFVKPSRSLPAKIIELTGITPDDLETARSVDEVMDDFSSYLIETVLVAHNASFDLSFLNYYSPRKIENPHIDSLRLARKLGDFESNSLDNLVLELDLNRSNAHRALDDARATAALFLQLAEEIDSPRDCRECEIPAFIEEKIREKKV